MGAADGDFDVQKHEIVIMTYIWGITNGVSSQLNTYHDTVYLNSIVR
jgi:hypothetical protein